MFIAGIGWERDYGPQEYRWSRIGKLWYDKDANRAKVFLSGWRFCDCIAKPFPNVTDPALTPEMSGDIMVQTGEWVKDGQPKKELLKIGYISTSDNNGQIVYKVRLEALPLNGHQFNEKGEPKHGVWGMIYLDSYERKAPVADTTKPSGGSAADFGVFDASDDALPF